MSNVDSMVNGKTITLTPKPNADGSLSWVWGWSADFLQQFRPKSESGSPWAVGTPKKEKYKPKLLNEESNDEKSNDQNFQKKKNCSR